MTWAAQYIDELDFDELGEPLPPAASASVAARPDQVLVIDDDRFMREALTAFFKSNGVGRVWHASDGDEAMKILNAASGIELVVLDVMMPNKDGAELVQKSQLKRRNLDVLLMSSNRSGQLEMTKTLAEAYGVNVLAAFHKPLNFAALASAAFPSN